MTLPETDVVRHGIATDTEHGAVVPPLHLSSNFTFAGFDHPRAYDYTRSGNPTRDLLGDALAGLEGGAGAVVTSSGMAAITLVLALLRPAELLVVPHDGYGGTWRLVQALAAKGHFELLEADLTDARSRAAAFARGPRMVWVETPSNPLLRLTDLAAVGAAARDAGALMVVDNTFLSPLRQQPIAFGADVVVHSTTKYLNGHSDVVGGAAVARTPELAEELTGWANCLGLTGSPFDSWLTLRGVRTLAARMRLHEANAGRVARHLEGHAAVERVHYPGLAGHPDRKLARRQQRGAGGMLSFELVDVPGAVPRFLDGLRCFSLAESLGGVESLVAHPATMTHAAMSDRARAVAGIGDRLLRLSPGIEAGDDLLADLDRALERVRAPARPGRSP